jgi:hypothetical protein
VEEALAEPLNQEFSIEIFVQPEEAMRPVPAGHTLVVRASSPRNLALAERALRTLGRTVIMARAAKQAERIDRLVEAIIEAFQFADGRPRAAIRRVLRALPEGMTPWQVAFWFASGNGWLEGAAPQDRLDEVEAVTAAAERMRHPAVG